MKFKTYGQEKARIEFVRLRAVTKSLVSSTYKEYLRTSQDNIPNEARRFCPMLIQDADIVESMASYVVLQ